MADPKPVAVTVDPGDVRYAVRGIGGNYCFSVNTPVTQYTLENLRPAFARTEMKLSLLKPEPKDGALGPADWMAAVKAADQPGSPIRHDLELMRTLERRRIPFSATIWSLPARTYTKPPTGPHAHNRIAANKWNEVLDCIAAYLLYAKEHYGVEPDYFSFNEPNIAVWVGFSAEEHREAIKRIGARFEREGLKTKWLLADASPARGTHRYALPAANDPEAMKYVGALAVHSWGGAQPQEYAAWADLAERLKLPLIIAEAGVNSAAWRDKSFTTFPYAVREMVHYQELFLHARPLAVLRWEYTADYSLVDWDRKTGAIRPTERFSLQKHWCTFIPPGSENLGTTTDDQHVLLTAFRHPKTGGHNNRADGFDYSFHVSNAGGARSVRVTGMPGHLAELNAVRTSQGVLFRNLGPLPASNGTLTLDLPPNSLTTLTTLRVPDAPAAEGPSRPSHVTIDRQGRTRIDGEPFFPIGTYAVGPDQLAHAKELGFNTVHTYAGEGSKDQDNAAPPEAMKAYLDAAHAAGLKVYMGLPRFQVVKGQTERLAARINLLKDSPALLAWYLFDEPLHQKVPAASVAASADLIRRLDANHPAVLVLCLVHERREQHRKDPAYLACADILMTDPYPVRAAQSDLSTVTREMAAARDLLDARKPLWNVVQLHGRGPGGPGYGLLEPTWAQLRNMTYQSLIAGARGITAFAYDVGQFKLHKSEQGLANARRITAELRTLAPILLADPPAAPPPFTLADNDALRTRWRFHEGSWYLFVVNLRHAATQITVTANRTGVFGDEVEVLFENRTLPVSDGRLSERIESIGVRAYRIAAE